VRRPLLPSHWGKKPCLSMAGVAEVRQLGPCARLLKRFRCANDMMINKHPSPMKGGARSVRMKNSLLFPF
jgi:hypothetical protein